MTQTPSSPAHAVVAPLELRRACGQFATGVTIVTVQDGDGVRGMTANSFTSVSLDPPLVLVSIDLKNRTHDLVRAQGRFAVNVLAQAHQAWSDRFAGRHGDLQHQFDDVPHHLVDGLPVLDGVAAALVCTVTAVYPAGDHTLFVGEVVGAETGRVTPGLVYLDGTYRSP